jgi:predicted tellurium resistance membrane protein TerC
MLALLTDPSAWLSFATLTVLEVVLGVDNVIFLSILVARLPPAQQSAARLGGLGLAMLTRILLLYSITWIATFTTPLVTLGPRAFSARGLVLGAGGLFLLWKGVTEMHAAIEGPAPAAAAGARRVRGGIAAVVAQIAVLDIVFSFDSVLTAVGLAQRREIMIAAIVLAIACMMVLARGISVFIERHPTIKVLALAFLILIGVALVAESLEFHIPKGYLYFSMAFALGVEFVNARVRRLAGRDAPRRGGS